jgi:hypothetical protein
MIKKLNKLKEKSTNFTKFKKINSLKHQIHLITVKRNLTGMNIINKIIF